MCSQLLQPAVTTRYELRMNPRTGVPVYVPVAVPEWNAAPQPVHPANYVFSGLAPPITRNTVRKAESYGGGVQPSNNKRRRRYL